MNHFIELTDRNTNKKVLINTNHIFSVDPDDIGCQINLAAGGKLGAGHMFYKVTENYETAVGLIISAS